MAEYFVLQICSSNSSSVRLILDILLNIGCSSTLLKQLYGPFSIIILDFVSSKKESVESLLYLNYFVAVRILEVHLLHRGNTTISNRH